MQYQSEDIPKQHSDAAFLIDGGYMRFADRLNTFTSENGIQRIIKSIEKAFRVNFIEVEYTDTIHC